MAHDGWKALVEALGNCTIVEMCNNNVTTLLQSAVYTSGGDVMAAAGACGPQEVS